MKILIKDKKHLASAANKLLKYTKDKKLFAFYGLMGVGKTTIIKAICEVLGTVDIVTSPTFTLVNEYRTIKEETLYHIDLYRIRKQEEVFDFGIEEYLTGDSYCFMEWPELIKEILPPETVRIRITVDDNEQRILLIS
ncbi:MAG TPA: tRNA (adenosine(37)-N6)-threonylcarbamoyltransferase complex ATPase subunit type 1 TsaE [Bacteroidales bacterium]|nr:tRNA (adenosine(37)-N6)-threonylcarbamoyltransferase complex ATPase subunit type 1 TsaE [Bacteroidales bacterium]